MGSGHGQNIVQHLIGKQLHCLQRRPVLIIPLAQQHGVDGAALEGFQQHDLVVGDQKRGDLRLRLGEFLEGRGEKAIDGLVKQPDPEDCGLHPGHGGGAFHRALQIQHQGTNLFIQGLTGLGQLYGTVAPMEQKKAQLFFQRADLLAHGGLGNEIIPGGIGEALGLRHGNEIVNLLDGQGKQPPFRIIITRKLP